MKTNFVAPDSQKRAFNCPHCGVLAKMNWMNLQNSLSYAKGFAMAWCEHCKKITIWNADRMIFPSSGIAPLPHPKLPDEIKPDYEEAREIASVSPRGAAALLRLAIQKLCRHLGEPGRNINDDIGSLVQKGLPERVQKAMDVVRVIGNESVHPGQIDLRDDPETAGKLFVLVNIITEKMIAEPEEIDELFEGLPETKKAGIAQRDGAAEAV